MLEYLRVCTQYTKVAKQKKIWRFFLLTCFTFHAIKKWSGKKL